MEIRFLGHSGFLVETGDRLLIFDDALEGPSDGSLEEGVIPPSLLDGRETLVFVSHWHSDHFNPAIFQWRAEGRRLAYLLSKDCRVQKYQGEDILRLGANQSLVLNGVEVRTLRSTDEGVAFLVKTGGRTLYHAGDLNWWHWEGEPEELNRQMARRYQAEIEKLKGEPIDLAFLPLDPRQGSAYLLGLDAFMRTLQVEKAIPMHFWDRYEVFDQIAADPRSAPYREKILRLTRRGERILLP